MTLKQESEKSLSLMQFIFLNSLRCDFINMTESRKKLCARPAADSGHARAPAAASSKPIKVRHRPRVRAFVTGTPAAMEWMGGLRTGASKALLKRVTSHQKDKRKF